MSENHALSGDALRDHNDRWLALPYFDEIQDGVGGQALREQVTAAHPELKDDPKGALYLAQRAYSMPKYTSEDSCIDRSEELAYAEDPADAAAVAKEAVAHMDRFHDVGHSHGL